MWHTENANRGTTEASPLASATRSPGGFAMPVTKLLHRDHELAVLSGALRGIDDGQPAVLLIQGPRGSGKTALLRSALASAPEHVLMLRARCHDTEHEFGLAMVRQLFDPLLERAGDGPSPDEFAAEQLRATVAEAA